MALGQPVHGSHAFQSGAQEREMVPEGYHRWLTADALMPLAVTTMLSILEHSMCQAVFWALHVWTGSILTTIF